MPIKREHEGDSDADRDVAPDPDTVGSARGRTRADAGDLGRAPAGGPEGGSPGTGGEAGSGNMSGGTAGDHGGPAGRTQDESREENRGEPIRSEDIGVGTAGGGTVSPSGPGTGGSGGDSMMPGVQGGGSPGYATEPRIGNDPGGTAAPGKALASTGLTDDVGGGGRDRERRGDEQQPESPLNDPDEEPTE